MPGFRQPPGRRRSGGDKRQQSAAARRLLSVVYMHCDTRKNPGTDEEYLAVDARGRALLTDPLTNKGTAFSLEERERLGLEGLVPPAVATMREQLERVYENFKAKPTDLERYIHLASVGSLSGLRSAHIAASPSNGLLML